jgi:predicted PurR-regulated permease PerM
LRKAPSISEISSQSTDRRGGAEWRDSYTRRVLIAVAITAAAVLLLVFLWYTVDVLLLAFAGVLLAIFLRSMSDWLSARTGLSAGWSLGLVVAALLGLTALGLWLLAPTVADQIDQLSQRLPEAARDLRQRVEQFELGRLLMAQVFPAGAAGGSGDGGALSAATGFFSSTLGVITDMAIILFFGLFLATDPDQYIRGLIKLFPHTKRPRLREVLRALGYTLRWWLIGRALAMIIIGVFTTLGLWVLGVPLALALGILAALLNFIPNIGPLLAGIPAVLLALTQSPVQALYVIILYTIIQTVEGYILTPLMDEQTVSTPPAIGIIGQVLLGVLVGFLGVAFAAPLTATVIVLVKLLYVEDVLGDPVEVPGEDSTTVKRET